jgi:hypothetical protein
MKHLYIAFHAVLGAVIYSTMPAALAQSETQMSAACALREPDEPRSRGLGTVVAIQDPAVARADIAPREARRGGAIDPRYLGDLRAVVRQDNGIVDIFDVPAGMTVHAGDRVKLQDSYRSKASACSYIPILIVPKDVPVA